MSATNIDEYVVYYSANSFWPRIGLKSAGKFVGTLHFKANGTTLPADTLVNGQPNLYYHLADFANVLDLLRNEKPITLMYLGSGGGFENSIQTSSEPVGEGE